MVATTTRKSLADICAQRDRIIRRISDRARASACAAHPETGGHPQYVHNWGNDAAKAAWALERVRSTRVWKIAERVFAVAEHARHDVNFRPLWCNLCKSAPLPEAS